MADFAKRIAAGEDAVADGRAAAALAITDDLRAAGCSDAAMFLIEARALALTDRLALALSVLAEGMILNPASGRLGVEQGKILTRLSRPVEAEAAFDAALSADGIAAVGRHPGGDIDGPIPLLRLRRRRGRHN